MRCLPRNKTKKHKLIIAAVKDFFGEGAPEEDKKSIKKVALYLMRRKTGLGELNEIEQQVVWHIKRNIGDKIYCGDFV